MKKFDFDNIFNNHSHEVKVIKKDDNYRLESQGNRLDFLLPTHIGQIIDDIKEKNHIEFNEINPLYADFNATVERNITVLEKEKMLKGVETSLNNNYQLNDYRFLLSFKSLSLTFFDEAGNELGEIDALDFVPDFQESNEDWTHGCEGLFLLYDLIGDDIDSKDLNE